MSLLTDLDAFSLERCCGDLDGERRGATVWLACEGGARVVRRVCGEEA